MQRPPQDFEFGEFRLHRRRRELSRIDGAPIELTAKAFDLLRYFLEHPGELIERSTLLETLWPGVVVEENNLSQTVVALRRVLGDDYITTVRGRGYQFVAEVRPAGAQRATTQSAASSRPSPRRAAAGVVVVLAGVAAVWLAGRALVELRGGPASAPQAIAGASKPPTSSAAAHAHYLSALEAMADADFFAMGHVPRAHFEHLDAALAADPEFAAAFAARGLAHLMQASNLLQAARADRDAAAGEIEGARRDAEHALQLDDNLGLAHAVLGEIALLEGRMQPAREHLSRAFESSRDDARTLSFVAGCWLRHGQRATALEILGRVRELKPVDHDVAYFFYLAGDRVTALEILRRVAIASPAKADVHLHLGFVAAIEGEVAEALTQLRVAEELYEQDPAPAEELPSRLSAFAYGYAKLGLGAEVRRVADRFENVITERTRAAPMQWTAIYLALGDGDKAYGAASRAVDTLPYLMLEELVLNASDDPVLEQPRFVALRRRAERRLSMHNE